MITKQSINEYISNRIIKRSGDFLYILPNRLLQPYISHYTITFPNVNTISRDYSVIPNGGSTLVYTFDGNNIGNRFYGPATRISKVGKMANRSDLLLIISFRPCGAAQFLRIDQYEISNSMLPFDTVELRLHKSIKDVFDYSVSVQDIVSRLDSIFLQYIDNETAGRFVLGLRDTICNGSFMSVNELSEYTHFSERHLRRVFGQYSGTSLKTYLRLARMNRAIKLIKRDSENITQAAVNAGYYDQSHFIHEFRSFCGITPSYYIKKMSDFYNEL